MLLPTYSETQIGATNVYNPCGGTGNVGGTGVPSHPSGFTWTTTANSGDTSYYWIWDGTSNSISNYNGSGYVRCVR